MPVFDCDECIGRTFSTREAYRAHLKDSMKHKPFKCTAELCQKGYDTAEELDKVRMAKRNGCLVLDHSPVLMVSSTSTPCIKRKKCTIASTVQHGSRRSPPGPITTKGYTDLPPRTAAFVESLCWKRIGRSTGRVLRSIGYAASVI